MTEAPPPGPDRNTALDGLRGYAAFAVVFYHTILATDPRLVTEVLRPGVQSQDTSYGVLLKVALSVLNGEIAVSMFFVISGIVLFQALDRLHGRNVSAFATSWRFLLRRILRIWPVMAACLVAKVLVFRQVDAALPGFVEVPTTDDLVVNLLLLRFPVHGATWTLFVEIAAAPILLLCLFAIRRLGPWIVLLFGAYAVLAHFKYHALLLHSVPLETGLPFLLAGVALASDWPAPLLRWALRGPVAALAFAVLVADMLLVPTEAYKTHASGLFLAVPLLVGWVYASHGGWLARVLQAPPSRYLGRISFSLYLWNVPVFELMLAALDPALLRNHPLEVGLLVGAAAVAVTIPIAHASERWLERPSIRAGRIATAPPAEGSSKASRIRPESDMPEVHGCTRLFATAKRSGGA